MKKFSQYKSRQDLSLDTILGKSHSLACCFCHTADEGNSFFNYLWLDENEERFFDNQIPNYVQDILSGKTKNINLPKEFRWIAVYNLRDENILMD